MEKRIFRKITSYAFVIFLTLPLWALLLSMIFINNFSFDWFNSFCIDYSIPFVSNLLSDLSSYLNFTSVSPLMLFLGYFISSYIYYLIVDVFIIVLDGIHSIMHKFTSNNKGGV